jgi:ribosomal protein S18 acetylase RimI-like enzyme
MSPGAPLIRAMRADDREAVVDLVQALNRHEDAITGDRPTDRAAAIECLARDEARVAETGGALLVAAAEGRVLGFLALAIEPGMPFIRPELRRHGHIMELVVAETARGRGIGSALLAEAERLTRAAGCRTMLIGVVAGNAGAEALYRRTGFRPYALEMLKRLD